MNWWVPVDNQHFRMCCLANYKTEAPIKVYSPQRKGATSQWSAQEGRLPACFTFALLYLHCLRVTNLIS